MKDIMRQDRIAGTGTISKSKMGKIAHSFFFAWGSGRSGGGGYSSYILAYSASILFQHGSVVGSLYVMVFFFFFALKFMMCFLLLVHLLNLVPIY